MANWPAADPDLLQRVEERLAKELGLGADELFLDSRPSRHVDVSIPGAESLGLRESPPSCTAPRNACACRARTGGDSVARDRRIGDVATRRGGCAAGQRKALLSVAGRGSAAS